ncbi:hypothetical protein [Brevundimonas sp.]|uniref:MotE family protein n=1 Tax=Brevundimonas sp. TaxID=1871086 RepID=UPI0025F4A48B|nr:hypothetical protein [Brevundimonas sp.]
MSRIPRILPLVAVALAGVAAVRLIGAGPDLFQGARAWAEEAAESAGEAASGEGAASGPPPPAACAVSVEELAEQAGLSPAELRILQNLSERRGQLDARDVDFETQLPLLIAAEAKADERIAELTALRTEIQGLLGQVSEREQAEIDRLVQVYQAMRPRDAAPVFSRLPDEVRLPVAAAMRPRALAAIMAEMEPEAARTLTERLARRFDAQRLAERAAPEPDEPAAQPTQPQPQRPRATETSSPPPRPRPPAKRTQSPPPRQEPPAQPPTAPTTQPEQPRVSVE